VLPVLDASTEELFRKFLRDRWKNKYGY